VAARDGVTATVRQGGGTLFRIPAADGLALGHAVHIAVRPEWHDVWRPDEVPPAENAIRGVVLDVVYLGETVHVLVRLPEGGDVRVALRNEGQLIKPVPWRAGDQVVVGWLPEDCQVLEDE
jgi:ABC-type Fe3+/spermidine/putrescine transport system ATPase subunit